jgi:rhamnogalacturonyl hydrolase YesR
MENLLIIKLEAFFVPKMLVRSSFRVIFFQYCDHFQNSWFNPHHHQPRIPLKPFLSVRHLLVVALGLAALPHGVASAATLPRAEIVADAEAMADAQLAQLKDKDSIGWVAAVMWAGYADFSHVSGKTAYADAIDQLGAAHSWTPILTGSLPYHADDLCIAQTFLDAYARKHDPVRLHPSGLRIAAVSNHIEHNEPADAPGAKKTNLTWWWCDALFMAPAGHARMSAITGDRRYLDAMDTEWWRTSALLYDKDEHLFYRDITFLHRKAPNGKPIFWTRGNGWVFAGLARTLTYMPADYPSRPRYVQMFQEMAAKLASLQQGDGTWRPSLLDPEQYPDSEMSGTALDCFAFAWGVNHGLLDRATYMPVIGKAWAAMLAARMPNGLLGYVQGVALAPDGVSPTGTQLYATGAFLMTACQLADLAPIEIPAPPQLAAPVPPATGGIKKIGDTVVDPAALTLKAGSEFGSTINGQAFQQDVIHSSHGWQYVAYYDGARHVCVARRKLPSGLWQKLQIAGCDFKSNDAHNTISLGICEGDGTIHLAFDHHVTTLHYTVSKPGVATHPESVGWDGSLFGPVHSDIEKGKTIVITYPRFWNTPDGGLQFHYREGSSGKGNNMLVDYNPATGTWSGTRQLDSLTGTYSDDVNTSIHRNAYPNGYDYDSTGRLQATWTWRESAGGVNHDLLYAYSDDRGHTWFTDDGKPINGPASVDTPGLAVENISRRYGLMNNQAQAVDSTGRMHVIMWSSDAETPPNAGPSAVWGLPKDRRYHHYWREKAGNWHDDVLPWVAGSRPRLYIDDQDNLIMIYNRPVANSVMESGIYFTEGDLVIAVATARAHWLDWRVVTEEKGPFINEMLADPIRWKSEKILSIMVQETPKVIGTPSPLRVLDYKWKKTL